MTAIELVKQMRIHDIALWVEGGEIVYMAPGSLDEEFTQQLKDQKQEVIDLLTDKNGSFLSKGFICQTCGNDLYVPEAYLWVGLEGEPNYGYQCVSCGTRYNYN